MTDLYGLTWSDQNDTYIAKCEGYVVTAYRVENWTFTIEKNGEIVDSLVRHKEWEADTPKQAMFLAVRALTRILGKSA